MFEEGLPNLRPLSFFNLSFDCPYISLKGWDKAIDHAKYKIPNASFLALEESFADLYLGWNDEGLIFSAHVKSPYKKSSFPDVANGDSIELFIDTRDVKAAGFTTKFCHHFYFLPEIANSHDRGEITRFRNEDAHELCQAEDLEVKKHISSIGYKLKVFIPTHCLFGYDPKETRRVGFTARINRYNAPSQHFSVISEEFPIEQQPSLWSSITLVQ